MEKNETAAPVLSDEVSFLGRKLAQFMDWAATPEPQKTADLVTQVVAQYVACSAVVKEMESSYQAGLEAGRKRRECMLQQDRYQLAFQELLSKPLDNDELETHARNLTRALTDLRITCAELNTVDAEHKRALDQFQAAATKWLDLAQFPSGDAVRALREITGDFELYAPKPEMFGRMPSTEEIALCERQLLYCASSRR